MLDSLLKPGLSSATNSLPGPLAPFSNWNSLVLHTSARGSCLPSQTGVMLWR